MNNKEFYTKLENNIKRRIDITYCEKKRSCQIINAAAKVMSTVIIITLQEYEKLKNDK